MPIRPENRERYPPDWPEISRRIRFARALGQCECEGECGLRHTGRCTARHNAPNPRTGSRVVLTVAHLDHTPENCNDTNLRAMCQGCHLHYDRDHHAETARRTRAATTAKHNTPLPGLEPAPTPAPARPKLPEPSTPTPAPWVTGASAIPARGHFPPKKDKLDPTPLLHMRPVTAEDRADAASYIASRARAADWTRIEHERTLLALFQPYSDTGAPTPEPAAADPEAPRWTPTLLPAGQQRRPAAGEHWSTRAACIGMPVEMFIGPSGSGAQSARSICASCEVMADCRREAIADPSIRGVWGGTTFHERVLIRGNLEAATSDRD